VPRKEHEKAVDANQERSNRHWTKPRVKGSASSYPSSEPSTPTISSNSTSLHLVLSSLPSQPSNAIHFLECGKRMKFLSDLCSWNPHDCLDHCLKNKQKESEAILASFQR